MTRSKTGSKYNRQRKTFLKHPKQIKNYCIAFVKLYPHNATPSSVSMRKNRSAVSGPCESTSAPLAKSQRNESHFNRICNFTAICEGINSRKQQQQRQRLASVSARGAIILLSRLHTLDKSMCMHVCVHMFVEPLMHSAIKYSKNMLKSTRKLQRLTARRSCLLESRKQIYAHRLPPRFLEVFALPTNLCAIGCISGGANVD